MIRKLPALGAVLFVAVALADDIADRARIIGEWQLPAVSGKGTGESWILESKDDAIHITQLQNGRKLAELNCNTMGHECDSDRHAKVSLWFNGPKLVEMETRGTEVVKRLFSAVDQGDAMEVEVIPIVPAGKSVVLRFKRVRNSAARK
jgi:hypothetical protein